jgi:ribonucleoside-triphosphate reductase
MSGCKEKVEVFSRVVGYFRPVSRWNDGKKEEFRERRMYDKFE